MFIEDINMVDLSLEGAKAVGMLILLFILGHAGRRYPELSSEGSWNLILFGFMLMFVGFLFDWSDEFINYEISAMADSIESAIEEISLIGGLAMVTIGFSMWFSFVGRVLGLTDRTAKPTPSRQAHGIGA